MRILTLSKQYPNAVQPNAGVFVERRLREILRQGDVEARVVAPVPWSPALPGMPARYTPFARVPRREIRWGIEVLHPRYPLVPKVGMTLHPFGMALASRSSLRRLLDEGFDFDVIDAHFIYPDGVAAALLSEWFRRPFVVTVRGSDISQFATYRLPRRLVRWAAARSAGIVAVCQALKEAMVDMGIEGSKITVLRNGVDLDAFAPRERDAARAELGWDSGPMLLSVGELTERKGHHVTIEALTHLPQWRLAIVGSGPEESALKALAARLGVGARVTFAGERTQQELQRYYNAADIFVLASSREGWANVLLESMACGTPVVATAIWGTPEVVHSPSAGVLAMAQTAEAIAAAVRQLWSNYPDRAATREYACGFSWDSTAAGQKEVYRRAASAAANGIPSHWSP